MGKNILVTVKGTKTDLDNQVEVLVVTSPGSYYFKGGFHYILYKETSLTGMEDTATSIKAAENQVTISRSGAVNMRQVFEVNQAHYSVYQTPFGSMDMMVKPMTVEVHLTEHGGSIKLEYELELSNSKLGKNTLEIMVKEC